MNKKDYYFCDEWDEDFCYALEDIEDWARQGEYEQITLTRAVKEIVSDMIWCNSFYEAMEQGTCGKTCQDYKPMNGKSGRCSYKGNFYERHGEPFIYNLNHN